jgi:hypothetical protein
MSSNVESHLPSIKEVIKELSRESEQDKAAAHADGSYLSNVDSGHLISREREYRDAEKHWVRTRWLECAREIASANGKQITYLTLPAYYRIDISLFHKHGLLQLVQSDGSTLAVAAFETDPTKFARMASQTPKLQLFGHAALEDVIVDAKNKYYTELMSLFPFDVVNLDLTTSLTPKHEGPYSRVMHALNDILARQAAHPKLWALFLTFRNVKDEWEQTALGTFLGNLQQNLDLYPKVREKFAEKYQVSTVSALAGQKVEAAITQSVVKWLVDRAHSHNVEVVNIRSYYYMRYVTDKPDYVITKLIMQFRRGQVSPHAIPTKDTPRQPWMDDDLVRSIAQNRHSDVEDILLRSPDHVVDGLEREVDELIRGVDETSRGTFG